MSGTVRLAEIMAEKDNRIAELEAERDKLKEGLEDLTDRLENGIKYDEENNQYILVWTERELEQAGREAEELMKFFNPVEC
jgi:hypothetical protein